MDQMQSVYIVQQLLTPSQLQRNATTALMRCASTANQSQKRLVRKKSLIMCVTYTLTAKKIDWLCTHPPGGKCVNCMRVPKKVAVKCNHPSNMFCPNCTGDKGKDKKEEVCCVLLLESTLIHSVRQRSH